MDFLGAHVSVAGGVQNAPERAAKLDSVVLQMFTKNARQWREPEFSAEDVRAFQSARRNHGIEVVVSHASYLINNASPDEALWNRSFRSLIAELRRCSELGVDYLVIHPGSATDGDRKAGVIRNAEALARAINDVDPDTAVLVECTTGKGNVLGGSPIELRELIDRVRDRGVAVEKIRACLDSCHLYSFGFDLSERYDLVMEQWDESLGLENVTVWHLNDSKGALGSGIDRHEHIGKGNIGLDGFRRILADPRWTRTPKLLETPKDSDATTADQRNLAVLRSLVQGGRDSLAC